MGKEGDLWDDSGLINAFDDAISKYKIMHGKGGSEGSPKGGKVISSTEENLSAIGDESSELERQMQENNSNIASKQVTETGVTIINPSSNKDLDSSNGQHVPDVQNPYSNTQGEEDYNRLLNQYYELEEQRQKILQQLYQFSGSNHQDSTYGSASYENQVPAAQVVHWGTTTSASHENHLQAASCPAVASCCSFAYPCLVGPCASLPACCVGICEGNTCEATLVNCRNGKSTSLRDGDLINTALGAAEKALSSLKMNDSGISDVSKDKAGEANEGNSEQENSSETDLSVVLNAWYSAGFHTGKYVSEQSLSKK